MSNKEVKENIVKSFKKSIKQERDINNLSKMKELIEKFNSLDENSKNSLINEFVNTTNTKEKENNKIICDREGHTFSKWIKYTYKESVPVQHTYDEWQRICIKCGKAEYTRVMPEELIQRQKNK